MQELEYKIIGTALLVEQEQRDLIFQVGGQAVLGRQAL